MTSLHQNSRQNTGLDNSINNNSLNANSSLSPVIQRKIESNHNNDSKINNLSNSRLLLPSKQIDYDTTSIASVSESSHWSGGAGEDLDNVALVNGSDINTMENKDWSTYLRMSKNGYNSSDQDEDEDDPDAYSDDDSSICEDKQANKLQSKQAASINKNKKKLNSNNKKNKLISKEINSSNEDLTDDDDLITSKKTNENDGNDSDQIDEDEQENEEEYDEQNGDEHVYDEDSYNDSEEDLDDDDIWTIKPKLYSYYEKQFKTMQPNLNGFIIGSVAKPFFERSKLPLNELSKIWELSDVTKDGALSFAEFCTAMHLVVLRVRNFELPNELPAKLQPYAPLIDFNSETNLNTNDKNKIGESDINYSDSPKVSNSDEAKPVHFGVKPQINSDNHIAHPVALRAKPNQQVLATSSNLIPEPPPRHSRSSSLGAVNNFNTTSMSSIPPPPLSQPQSNTAVFTPTVTNTPKILQQQPPVPPRITSPPTINNNQQQNQADTKLLPPPPPPLPQHHSYHQSRILSIQNHNHVQQYSTPSTNKVSYRIVNNSSSSQSNSQTNNFANEDLIKSMEVLVDKINKVNLEQINKLNENKSSEMNDQLQSQDQADILVESIRHHTEQNQSLRKIFNELEKELRSLTDQRIALEIKLDYLNSKSINNIPTTNTIINSISTPAISLSTNTPQTNQLNNSNKQVISLTAKSNSNSSNINNSNAVTATPISAHSTAVPSTPLSSNQAIPAASCVTASPVSVNINNNTSNNNNNNTSGNQIVSTKLNI